MCLHFVEDVMEDGGRHGGRRTLFLYRITYLIEHFALGFESFAGTNVLQGVQDLLSIRVLLMTELIGGESQNDLENEKRNKHTAIFSHSNKGGYTCRISFKNIL